MDARGHDGSGWSASLGTAYMPPPHALPPPVGMATFRSSAHALAALNALLLAASPLVFLLARRALEAATPGMLVFTPPLPEYLYFTPAAGVLLLLLVVKTRVPPRWISRAACPGWVCVLALALLYFSAGVLNWRDGAVSARQRAYIEATRGNGRGARPTILLRLQDGRGFLTNGFRFRYGDGMRCYSVATRVGPNDFAWIDIFDASPPPGPGQLAWPVNPGRCFSAMPLAAMRA
jgi:hypothetical protein